MLYLTPPKDFHSKFEVVSCNVLSGDFFLLLHRNDGKTEGDTWAPPGGKVEPGETPLIAVAREVQEETGLKFPLHQFKFFKTTYVRFTQYDFIFHIFSVQLSQKPVLLLKAEEHKNFLWVTPRQALGMKLLEDEDVCIKIFFKV